jgi:hypothetical protein
VTLRKGKNRREQRQRRRGVVFESAEKCDRKKVGKINGIDELTEQRIQVGSRRVKHRGTENTEDILMAFSL